MRIYRIDEIIKLKRESDFVFALDTFLDRFKLAENKATLLVVEPSISGLTKYELCSLAAVAHKLANDYDLPIPDWVMKQKYIMPKPVYAFDTSNPEYQAYLKISSPPEFALRNLFVGENAIARV